MKFAMSLSDAVLRATAKLSERWEMAVKAYDKPVMPFVADGDPVKAHAEFYQTILEEALV